MAAIDGPPMPWQQHVLDVACEIDPATGLYFYRTVVVVVPRQAGKTSVSRSKSVHRAITDPGVPILYTAQDRNKALRRLRKNFYVPIRRSELGSLLGRPRWAAGSEAIRFRNDSEIFIDAAGKKTAGHGETLPEAHIDEAFAHVDSRIEQSVNPMMITVKGAQKWILSAAGDSGSVYLWGKVEAGRARCETGNHGRSAYFEWSTPTDADRDDPATLLLHPAVGHTIALETLQTEHDDMDPTEYDRAYNGWWPRARAKPWVIPQAPWGAAAIAPDDVSWSGDPIWCVDVAPERDWSAIGYAATASSGRCWLEVAAHDEGTSWVVRHLVTLRAKFGGNLVVLDGSGPAAALQPDLEAEGFEVRRLSLRDKVDACGALHDAVLADPPTIEHGGDPALDTALAGAAKRRSGDAFVWARGASFADITPLYAVTLARFVWVQVAGDEYDPNNSTA